MGGTHYYTQSLIFGDSVLEDEQQHNSDDESQYINSSQIPKTEDLGILDQPTEVLIAKLREVDPIMADRWHPNERRKIVRSLEIYLKTGKPASQLYSEQAKRKGLNVTQDQDQSHSDGVDDMIGQSSQNQALPNSTSTRYPTLLFWVHAEADVLKPRLDARVEKMVEEGLLDEINSLDQFLMDEESAGRNVDRSRGIWVSIGYKEFSAYQDFVKQHGEDEIRNNGDLSKKAEALKSAAVEKVKVATRQYAKRQIRWIRIKLLNALRQSHNSNQDDTKVRKAISQGMR